MVTTRTRILLLTQRPELETEFKAAINGARVHVVAEPENAALDSLLPAALRLVTGLITFTKELTVDLVRFVPVGAVLRFELTALDLRSSSDGSKQEYYVISGALLSGGGGDA